VTVVVVVVVVVVVLVVVIEVRMIRQIGGVMTDTHMTTSMLVFASTRM
jgi:hypothetical protein